MGRAASITLGNASDGLRLEHVRSKRVVRLIRWDRGAPQEAPVELSLSDFCAGLGIRAADLAPPCRYLLFAGTDRPGVAPMVAAFEDQERAREAIVVMRRTGPGTGVWAEVAEIGFDGELRRVCWFGQPWGANDRQALGEESGSQSGSARPRMRKRSGRRMARRVRRS